MSHRFHSFRAPANTRNRNPKQTVLPLPPVTSRKAATRLIRDVTLGLRSLSKPQLTVTAITFVLVCLWCFQSSSRRVDTRFWNSHLLRTTECACPTPRTPEIFVDHVLSNAGFVANVRITKALRGFLVLEILELYRGHGRAVQWPMLVQEHSVVACHSDPHPGNRKSTNTRWLVVANGITSPPSDVKATLRSSLNAENVSFLLPGELKGPRCHLHVSTDTSSAHRENKIVWMTPWDGLSKPVAENIARDSGNEPLWWRTKDASLEFKDSIRRAVNASDSSNSRIVSDLAIMADSSFGSTEWWLKDGVSVIAACKDRTQTLRQAILTWLAARGVNEIVVVDWSSNPSIKDSLNDDLLSDPRFILVRSEGQSQWILSRAYNLAARFSSFSRLLKVDCDTVLSPDFFAKHNMERDEFFAGDWRQLEAGATNALHTNGLLYLHRDDFVAVGGFDERITTYGWDDSDLAGRLSGFRTPRAIKHETVQHISHPASFRVRNQPRNSLLPSSNPFAASVEIQRNRLLLTKYGLPVWRADSAHIVWNVRAIDGYATNEVENREAANLLPFVMHVKQANDVTAASALVSEADADEVAKRSIRLILRRLGLSWLPNTLTSNFYKALIAKVGNPEKYAEVVMTLQGGCISKLLAHVSSKEATAPGSLEAPDSSDSDLIVPPPSPYIGWRLQELWQSTDTECSCTFPAVFDAKEEEVLPEWVDDKNYAVTGSSNLGSYDPQENITNTLSSFSARAAVKNMSMDVSKWYQKGFVSRMLSSEAYCSGDPTGLTRAERQRLRRSLAALVPSKAFLKGIRDSLAAKSRNILDSSLLDESAMSGLLSETQARHIQGLMTSTQLSEMVARWVSNIPLSNATVSRTLLERSRALMIAIYLAESGVEKGQRAPSNVRDLQRTVSEVSVLVRRLFHGCQTAPSKYIEEYPELAPIIAGFFSSRLCL